MGTWANRGTSQSWNPHAYGTSNDSGGCNDGEEIWNGLVFHADQVFFPRTSAWDSLRKALKAGLGELTSVRELEALLAAPPTPPDEPLDWIEEYHEAYDEREIA